jgi:hypothetical protein
LQYTWSAVYKVDEEKSWERVGEENTHLAILIRLANVEERASATFVVFTTYNGVHHT